MVHELGSKNMDSHHEKLTPFSFFFSLSRCLKEEALARGWQICMPTSLSNRGRAGLSPEAEGNSGGSLHINYSIFFPRVYFYSSLIFFRASNIGFSSNILV